MKFKFLIILFFLLTLLGFYNSAQAIIVTGKVTGQNKEALPFANVYVKGTTKGTTTNIEGNYRLDITEGSCELVFRYLGYKMHVENLIIAQSPLIVDVQLAPENYTLAEVNIKAQAEDPAYPIIRKAIAKRKFYLNQVDEFSCDVYIKGLQKLTSIPKTFMGIDINLSEFVDSTTGIIYLSESVSKYHFKKPNDIKEVMVSSKVSGSNKAFSFNQASDMDFNFYENIIGIGGLSERGFISPISSNALFYYRYRLDGSFLENGHWVNRIEVIAKRKNDPVFAGYIFIQDSTWRIHSTDLYLTKESQMQFVDTLRINQVFIPVSEVEDIWKIGSETFRFVFSAFGFAGNGSYVGVFSGYDVNPEFRKKFFNGSVMKINEDANKRDTTYWEKMRPIPLTPEELTDYTRRDSMQVIKESKPYLDSLDRISNKFKPVNLLSGYTYEDKFSKTEYSFSSMLENVQFNTVEGLSVGIGMDFTKKFENLSLLKTDLTVRYGFSNEKWNAVAGLQYNWNIKKFAFARLEGGDNLVQFNESAPISPLINTGYTLFGEKNYMKHFRKQYGKLSARIEPLNGIRFTGNIEYSHREAVSNTTDYTLVDVSSRSYTSNDPRPPLGSFKSNDALKLDVSARIRIKQKYIDRPDMNYIIGSKYPDFMVSYAKGINGVFGSDVDYDKIELGVSDNVTLGMIGKFSYNITYGKFLNSNKIYLMDYAHFNGNQTFFSSFEKMRFDLLDYYSYSTSDEYIAAYAEHDFGGFILNKIPLLRKLKLNEIAGFRYLHVPGKNEHFETAIGLEKLHTFRADFVIAFNDKGQTQTGFVVGIRGLIGK